MLFKVLIQLSLLPVFFSPKPQFCSFFFLLFECCCILCSCYNFGDFHTNPCAIQPFSLFNCMQVFFLLWLFAFLFSCFFPIAFFVFSLSMVIHILSFGIFYVLSSRISPISVMVILFFFFLVATFFLQTDVSDLIEGVLLNNKIFGMYHIFSPTVLLP